MPSAHQTTPSVLNVIILSLCIIATLLLLWLGSQATLLWALVYGIVMSFVLLTNYALMHEAAHYNLHKQPRFNYLLGTLSAWFFPMSFTIFQVTHQVHHRCNRTDYEMFDYYYPDGNRWLKRAQWYSILIGLYWPTIPVGTLLMAVFPKLAVSPVFKKARSTQVLFDDFGKAEILKVRLEVFGGIVFWWIIISILQLNPLHVVVMYLCFGVNWSTRQYVTHAFTPRDVVNGAFNLKVGFAMRHILLNGHWDLVHHQHPDLPWTQLPEQGRKQEYEPSLSYWRQYVELWLGPKEYTQPGPKPLTAAELNKACALYADQSS
ncbi:MAG: fatty acid desaturase [Gammaproteobacteria bacterium]|jgi:fatty acid desaturase